MDKAIAALEPIVREEPTYQDSLTLLGRAYYRKGRYEDARQILQRALLVNKEDEIAWLVLGLTQLRVGENDKGLEILKGAVTLLSKVSRSGYRNFPDWDSKGLVRSYISRSVQQITKEPEAKDRLIQTVETLLARVDDEENFQRIDAPRRSLRERG